MASAAPATAATMVPTCLPRSAVWLSSSRRSATAFVSSRRSSASSRLSSGSVAILQRLRRQSGFLDRLLGQGLRGFLQHDVADADEDRGDQDQPPAPDEQRRPNRQRRRQARRSCGETEGEGQERENCSACHEADPYAERSCFPFQLGAGELKLELNERPRVIGNALGGVGESVHGVLLTTTQGP